MAEAAENLDSIASDEGGAWKETLAGDNTEVLESLKDYESPDKFLEEFNSLKNKDWRDDFAGDDLKFKSTLERFKSAGDFANSYREAQQKIRGGELNQTGFPKAPENATDDDMKAFREQHGIPLEASQYLESLPEGLVIGDDDKPYMESFAAKLHEKNLPPEAAHAAVEWYNEFQEQEQTARIEADREDHRNMEDELRKDWGSDYRANINLANSLIAKTFGEETAEAFKNARGMDGVGLMNNKAILEGLVQIARTIDPLSEIVPPGGDAQKTLNDEIADIEKVMKDNRTAYNKDEKMQERYRYLLDLRLKDENK